MDVLIHKKFPDELMRYLFKVYTEKTLCDTVIHTPDGGAFQCHKIIVTASSTYLHNVLSQASQVHSSFSVDVNANILQVLLEYMYTGQLFVSDLTRNAISEAATYLQIYPVLDLLKETAKDDFTTDRQHGSAGAKVYTEMSDQGTATGYDSENTIVDDAELLATFNTIAEEEHEFTKGRNRHPQKATKRSRKSRDWVEDETYTAIKVEKDIDYDDYENDSQTVNKNSEKVIADTDPDFEPYLDNQKHMKQSKDRSKRRSKGRFFKPNSEPSGSSGKKRSKPDLKEKTKSKRKSKNRNENEEPIPKIRIKSEKVKSGKVNETARSKSKNKRVLQVKEDGPVKIVVKGNSLVKIKQEKGVETPAKSSPKKQRKVRKVFKPSKKDKCACSHCRRKFPGYVFLRKHLLVRHKQSFSDDWEFSRYLIKFYSGISKYVENCTVDIRGHKNKYRCTKCKKTYKKYCLFCLHFQRDHMKKNPNFRGKFNFFIISRKLKRLENFLCGILEAKSQSELKEKVKLNIKDKVKKVKTAQCNYCYKMFVNDQTLRAHQKKMHGIQPSRKYFVLREEKRSRGESKWFECALCQCEKYMVSQYALQKHLRDFHKLDEETARMRSHEVPYQLNCEVISCGFKTNNILSMKTHVAYSHPFIQHPCSECKMVFQVRLLLDRHKFTKHSLKESYNFMCAHCDKRFPKQFRLKVHEFYKHGVEHQDIKLYRCEEPGCEYVTASQSSLKVHGSKHVKEKRFTCEFCGMKLKTTLSHQKHVNKMHLGIRPYLCQVCGQSFGEDHELKSHIRNKHTTEYDYQCDHCPYRTTNKGTFYTHLYNVHKVRADDDKRVEFRCPHPGCKFVSILHHRFQTHLNGHTNTRTYCCKPCNKWFVSSSTLRAHKQWYHSDKVHSCTQCNYQTKTSQKLNEHIRVQHQLKGLKPFKCPYCEFRCATGGNTRKHVKQVHRGRVVTYLRDDSLLTAAKMAKASGQSQPLINILSPEALNSSIPMSYPASAKKLGLVPGDGEAAAQVAQGVQAVPEMSREEKVAIMQQVATKMEEEQVPASVSQVPEHSDQMILASNHLEVVSAPDPRTQGPVDIGAQVTVDIQAHLPPDLRNQLSLELRNQINTTDLHNQLTAQLRNQMSADLHNQIQTDLRNQLPVEQAMQLASTGQQIAFSTGHDYIPAVSSSHHMPISGHPLMPMMIPQVPVSVGSYEEVKDNSTSSNLTIIG